MVSPGAAATACMQSVRTIYRLLEAGELHGTEGDAGLRICLASVSLEKVKE